MRKNGITHEKEESLHMRKKGHYMWERRVNTREKEGSLHMRKNGRWTFP
jgi:hypothetical protein